MRGWLQSIYRSNVVPERGTPTTKMGRSAARSGAVTGFLAPSRPGTTASGPTAKDRAAPSRSRADLHKTRPNGSEGTLAIHPPIAVRIDPQMGVSQHPTTHA